MPEKKTYLERVKAILPKLKEDYEKARAFEQLAPQALANQAKLVATNAETPRSMVTSIAAAVAILEPKKYSVGMTTQPGDVVEGSSGMRYVYVGTEPMTHDDESKYPGAPGLAYWHLVPKLKDGSKVFPAASEGTVLVATGERWWNPDETALYEWTGEAYDCPTNFYPGAAGVQQWVKVK